MRQTLEFVSGTVIAVSLLGLPAAAQALGSGSQVPLLKEVGIEQKLGDSIDLSLALRDESGREVPLSRYFGQRPVLISPVYYDCPMLCPLALDGLTRSLRALSFSVGEEFEVLTFSINPDETPSLAAAKKRIYLRRYDRAGAREGWHFLTGDEATIRRLTAQLGFHYRYDAEHHQYAHASALMLLTPEGKLARYFYGVEYAPRDLRLGLIEASRNRIGSPIDSVLLLCYHYDPTTGRYGLVIFNSLRVAGLLTVLALGSFIVLMLRKERRGRAG